MGCVDEAVWKRHMDASMAFPRIERGNHEYPVAVCGGGLSLTPCLEELRAWPGDIWAINDTADYLLSHGIGCTMFTIDPLHRATKAHKRLLASCCDPSLFDGDVRVFDLAEHAEGGIPGGSTSAARAAVLSLRMGYPGASFFGCDSSFEDRTHCDRHEVWPEQLIVRAGGVDFRTSPQMYMQAECLSAVFKFPVFQNRSGGLVAAMTADPEWEVVAVSGALREHLKEVNGEDLFAGNYKPPCPSCGQAVGHYDDCEVGMGVCPID